MTMAVTERQLIIYRDLGLIDSDSDPIKDKNYLSIREKLLERSWNSESVRRRMVKRILNLINKYRICAEKQSDLTNRAFFYSSARHMCDGLIDIDYQIIKLWKQACLEEALTCIDIAQKTSTPSLRVTWACKVIRLLFSSNFQQIVNKKKLERKIQKCHAIAEAWEMIGDAISNEKRIFSHIQSYLPDYIRFPNQPIYFQATCYRKAIDHIKYIINMRCIGFDLTRSRPFQKDQKLIKLINKGICNLESLELEIKSGGINDLGFMVCFFEELADLYQFKLNEWGFQQEVLCRNDLSSKMHEFKKHIYYLRIQSVELCDRFLFCYEEQTASVRPSRDPRSVNFWCKKACNLTQAAFFLNEREKEEMLAEAAICATIFRLIKGLPLSQIDKGEAAEEKDTYYISRLRFLSVQNLVDLGLIAPEVHDDRSTDNSSFM